MSNLFVAALPDEAAAHAARRALLGLQKQHLTEMEDIVIVTRDSDGAVSLQQTVELATGTAIGGGRWGMLIGSMFLDPAPDPRARKGSAPVVDSFVKLGVDRQFLDDVAGSLDRGGAAVGMRVRRLSLGQVLDQLHPFMQQIRVIHTALDHETEARLTAFVEKMSWPDQTQGQRGRKPWSKA